LFRKTHYIRAAIFFRLNRRDSRFAGDQINSWNNPPRRRLNDFIVDTASRDRYRSPLVLGGEGGPFSAMDFFAILPVLPPDVLGVTVGETELLAVEDSGGAVLLESQPKEIAAKSAGVRNDANLLII
jgi:hypothetical protein